MLIFFKSLIFCVRFGNLNYFNPVVKYSICKRCASKVEKCGLSFVVHLNPEATSPRFDSDINWQWSRDAGEYKVTINRIQEPAEQHGHIRDHFLLTFRYTVGPVDFHKSKPSFFKRLGIFSAVSSEFQFLGLKNVHKTNISKVSLK